MKIEVKIQNPKVTGAYLGLHVDGECIGRFQFPAGQGHGPYRFIYEGGPPTGVDTQTCTITGLQSWADCWAPYYVSCRACKTGIEITRAQGGGFFNLFVRGKCAGRFTFSAGLDDIPYRFHPEGENINSVDTEVIWFHDLQAWAENWVAGQDGMLKAMKEAELKAEEEMQSEVEREVENFHRNIGKLDGCGIAVIVESMRLRFPNGARVDFKEWDQFLETVNNLGSTVRF